MCEKAVVIVHSHTTDMQNAHQPALIRGDPGRQHPVFIDENSVLRFCMSGMRVWVRGEVGGGLLG